MDDLLPAVVLVGALLAAVYVVNRVSGLGGPGSTKPPLGASPGTLRLGQFAVQPGAAWLVLGPGDF